MMEGKLNYPQRSKYGLVKPASDSGRLDKVCTPTEARRMRAYCIDGLLLKEIAHQENVHISRVSCSIKRGMERLREAGL